MKNCTKLLVAAVMGISLNGLAFGQAAQNGVGATGNSGGATPTGAADPQGNAAGSTAAGATGAAAAGSGATATDEPRSSGSNSTAAGTTTGGDSSTVTTPGANDAMGSQANQQSREMQRGAMGARDADAKIDAILDRLATTPDKAGDSLFVLQNACGNMFEVELAKLVQSKSQDEKVKELAAMIARDHAAANEKLMPIARKLGLDLPSGLPSEKQKMLAIYAALPPADLDTAYLLDMKADHAKDITSFSDQQKAVKDESLRGYISETLPKLKEHGMHVQMVAADKGFGSPMMTGQMGDDAKGMGHDNMGHDANTTPRTNNQNPSNR